MLISEIITEVLLDVGADTSDTELAGKALNGVKDALRMFPLFCRDRLLITTSTVTLLISTNSVALPSGFIRELEIYRESNGARIPIDQYSNFKGIVNTETTGSPIYYNITGSTLYFDKTSDKEYSIKIKHTKEVDDVVAGDTFFGDSRMIRAVKEGTKGWYFSDYTEEGARGDKKTATMIAMLDKIEEQYMISSQGGHID